jgi:hypothetical protein
MPCFKDYSDVKRKVSKRGEGLRQVFPFDIGWKT